MTTPEQRTRSFRQPSHALGLSADPAYTLSSDPTYTLSAALATASHATIYGSIIGGLRA